MPNNADELGLTDEYKMKAWVEHYVRLLNVEFEWPNDDPPRSQHDCDPDLQTTHKMICKTISPSAMTAERLKIAGGEGVKLERQLA